MLLCYILTVREVIPKDSDMVGDIKLPGKKKMSRSNGAYKLLVYLIYGEYSYLERTTRGVVTLKSVRKLAGLLGTQSVYINRWLIWLESQGYIENMYWTPNKRSVTLRLRGTAYVI